MFQSRRFQNTATLPGRRHKPTRENLINGNSRHVMESRILYGPHVAWPGFSVSAGKSRQVRQNLKLGHYLRPHLRIGRSVSSRHQDLARTGRGAS